MNHYRECVMSQARLGQALSVGIRSNTFRINLNKVWATEWDVLLIADFEIGLNFECL